MHSQAEKIATCGMNPLIGKCPNIALARMTPSAVIAIKIARTATSQTALAAYSAFSAAAELTRPLLGSSRLRGPGTRHRRPAHASSPMKVRNR